jgi:uncharacterized membrane protein (DUF106 family)
MAIEWLTTIPNSTIFVLVLSFAISFATSFTNRLLTDRSQLKTWNKEISQWRTDSLQARRTGDKKLMAKVKKQESHIMQLQSKMMWQSMKTSFLWFIPLMLMWYYFLPQIMGNVGMAVAYIPWIGGAPFSLNVFLWYLICSFLASALFTRLFGLGLGTGGD